MNTAVITGATSGIGYATAKRLLAMGYRVLLAGRTAENCEKAQSDLKREFPDGDIVFFCGDLMQQEEVRRVAGEMANFLDKRCGGRLDVLINNAGAVRTWYATTKEGYEQQFALNHLAGFLLAHLLMGYLKRAGGRMILTGSGSHKHARISWDDVMFQKRRYSCLRVYKQTKMCNMLFAKEFNRRFVKDGVRAYVVDPGLVSTDIGFKGTSGIVRVVWCLRKRGGIPADQAALTYAFLCKPPYAQTGVYYLDSREAPYDSRADNARDGAKLFELSERLCGIASYGEGNA